MGRRKARSKQSGLRVKTSRDNRNCVESRICREREDRSAGAKEKKTDVPIGIYARLTYPLVTATCSKKFVTLSSDGEYEEEGAEEEEEVVEEEEEGEEERIELNVKPRFVFVSSLCAICLQKPRLFCERCRMVCYCSRAHRSKGIAEHRDLCEALLEIRSSIVSTLSDESGIRLDAEEYRAYRVQLLGVLQSKVRRPLKLWETEIVLYPTVCRICRRFHENLIRCEDCGMECYCEDHAADHDKWCKEFRTLQRCLLLQYKHGSTNPLIPNVRRSMILTQPELDFDSLMHRIYGDCRYYREMDSYTYSVLSHVCTIPLTALYAMQISSPESEWSRRTECTIHVVGAEFQFEGINLDGWEKLFLHFLPNLKRVNVWLVGPELRLPNGVPAEVLSKVKVCRECKSAGRAVIVRFRPGTLYHELVRTATESEADASKPDLICAFNPGLYRTTGFAGRDSWYETIREFARRSCAVAITSYTVDEIFWEMARIKSIANVEVLLEPRENPFASIKPDRNFVTDHSNPLIYKNYYISIVRGSR